MIIRCNHRLRQGKEMTQKKDYVKQNIKKNLNFTS